MSRTQTSFCFIRGLACQLDGTWNGAPNFDYARYSFATLIYVKEKKKHHQRVTKDVFFGCALSKWEIQEF